MSERETDRERERDFSVYVWLCLYKQCLLTCLPYLPSLTLRYIPSVGPYVCVCGGEGGGACAREGMIMTIHIYIFFGFTAYITVGHVKRVVHTLVGERRG